MAMVKPDWRFPAWCIVAGLFAQAAQAQQLPPASRTMFKCTVGKTVSYSDEPCLGAQRIDVEPTRGLNKYSGKERIGADVAHERRREGAADALMPLTGMNARQFAVASRRHRLGAAARTECASLDALTAQGEADERNAPAASRPAIQRALFEQRKRYRQIGC